MQLVVFHRLSAEATMRLKSEWLAQLAAGETVPKPPTVFTTVFGTPLPVEFLQHARVNDEGTQAVLNLTGWSTMPGYEDYPKAQCPQIIRPVTVYENGVQDDLWRLCKGAGIDVSEVCHQTRSYRLFQPNECAILESADLACTLEEVQALLHQCRYQQDQLMHNASIAETQRAFRTLVKVETDRLQILLKMAQEKRLAAETEREQKAQEGLRFLKGWALVHGSEKLQRRIAGNFTWQPLAEVEWAKSICSQIIARGSQPVKHGKYTSVELRTTPTLGQMRELAEFITLLPQDGEAVLDAATTLVWVREADEQGSGYVHTETQIQVTVMLPTLDYRSLYFKTTSPESDC
jgi:hypothetical protein